MDCLRESLVRERHEIAHMPVRLEPSAGKESRMGDWSQDAFEYQIKGTGFCFLLSVEQLEVFI